MGLVHIYVGDFGAYTIPEHIVRAAGVTSGRSVWDRRYSSAGRLAIWGRWMDRCEMGL